MVTEYKKAMEEMAKGSDDPVMRVCSPGMHDAGPGVYYNFKDGSTKIERYDEQERVIEVENISKAGLVVMEDFEIVDNVRILKMTDSFRVCGEGLDEFQKDKVITYYDHTKASETPRRKSEIRIPDSRDKDKFITRTFHENGFMATEAPCEGFHIRHGLFKRWDEQGKLVEMTTYKNDEKHGPAMHRINNRTYQEYYLHNESLKDVKKDVLAIEENWGAQKKRVKNAAQWVAKLG
jgi:antitoxin component YwqK of YwqJK toxin-antitoxin module